MEYHENNLTYQEYSGVCFIEKFGWSNFAEEQVSESIKVDMVIAV